MGRLLFSFPFRLGSARSSHLGRGVAGYIPGRVEVASLVSLVETRTVEGHSAEVVDAL